jgi:hypothetical protein
MRLLRISELMVVKLIIKKVETIWDFPNNLTFVLKRNKHKVLSYLGIEPPCFTFASLLGF